MKDSRFRLSSAMVAALIILGALYVTVPSRSGARADAPSTDGVKVDPNNYKIRYQDAHIRLVEVVVRPGETEKAHTDPYPLVIVRDATLPSKLTGDTSNAPGSGQAGSPKDLPGPFCSTVAAQPLHAISNMDTFPLHYYRIEFKRIDGDAYPANWKTWYPWMLDPLKPVKDVHPPADAKPFSKDFPFPIAYDSYIAAPNNHYMRYLDNHVRFLEVTFRAGERENLHGHPYPSAFEHDMGGPTIPTDNADGPLPEAGLHRKPDGSPMRTSVGDIKLDPNSPQNDMGGHTAPPPAGAMWPTCNTGAPQAPHQAFNGHAYPTHFYRIEFKRLDADGIKTHWKAWYPWMAQGQ